MGDGTKENPYTREDVDKLITENGGTAKGLDLSGKWFEKGIDLCEFDLKGIILQLAHLERADLSYAHLEEADLRGAHFVGTYLGGAHLEGADLWFAHLEGAFLSDAQFSADTRLEEADWGNYILAEERIGWFAPAADTYRRLKIWYTNAGMYDVAGNFFFGEMTAKRKVMKWWPNPLNRVFSKLLSILCGYGEKPERVVRAALATILSLALAYRLWGSFNTSSIWDTLYYSVVSFTAVGYGNWAPHPTGWAKGMGAAEAIIGVFMMALFLVTFTRKMTR